MAAGRHNVSRRAVLGAAVALSLAGARGPLHQPSAGPPPRYGEDWVRTLAVFRAAEAGARAWEGRTEGLLGRRGGRSRGLMGIGSTLCMPRFGG